MARAVITLTDSDDGAVDVTVQMFGAEVEARNSPSHAMAAEIAVQLATEDDPDD